MQDMSDTVDFGFADIPRHEKASRVQGLFGDVAARYDVMNDLMSAGVHRLWKRALLDTLQPRADMHLLDVAGGTGDVAFGALARAPDMRVTLCDLTPAMLQCGRTRALNRGQHRGLQYVCANAERLPLRARCIDAYTIAFGLRNVTDRMQALREAWRVLKPGGKFLCLEFSQVTIDALAPLYDAFSFRVIPHLGKWITGDGAPYRYLVESIRRFPNQEHLASMLRDSGFSCVRYRSLSGGIAALHWGIRA